MILLAVMRSIMVTRFSEPINWIVTIYLYGLSALMIILEFEVTFVKEQFYLLNFGWGKGVLNLFMGLLCLQFEIGMWPQYIIALIFIATGGAYIAFSVLF